MQADFHGIKQKWRRPHPRSFLSASVCEVCLLRLLDSLRVITGLGIDPNDIAFVDEHRHMDGGAGFECDGFGRVAGGIAFDGGSGFGDLEFDLDRIAECDDLVIECRRIKDAVRFDEFDVVTHLLVGELETVTRVLRIAEPVFAAICEIGRAHV